MSVEARLDRMRRLLHRLDVARRTAGSRGLAVAVAQVGRQMLRLARAVIVEALTDAALGASTGGIVSNEERVRGRSVEGDPLGYQPIHVDWWRRTITTVPLVPAQSTFVDLGSGRGRALLLAVRRGFRQVVGVELDEDLVAAARANLRRWRGRPHTVSDRLLRRRLRLAPGQQARVVHGDAATYPFPTGPLVVFIFNAFGPQTLQRVVDNLRRDRASCLDETFVLYFNPRQAHVFDDAPDFVVHARGHDFVVYRLARDPRAGLSAVGPPAGSLGWTRSG